MINNSPIHNTLPTTQSLQESRNYQLYCPKNNHHKMNVRHEHTIKKSEVQLITFKSKYCKIEKIHNKPYRQVRDWA